MSFRFVTAFCLAISLAAPVASAAPPDEAAKATARKHYDDGVKLYDLGHFEEAIKEFETAYQVVPNALLLYNLAQSHRRLGHLDKAKELYRAYLRREPNAANRADVEARIAALEKTQGPPDQVVGSKEAENPKPIAPAPPEEKSAPPVVGATLPPEPTSPAAAVSSPASVAPEATPAPVAGEATAVATPAETASSGTGLRTAGLITGGAGVVMLGLGTMFGVQTNQYSEDARKSPVYDPDKVSKAESAETMQWVFLGLGAASVAAGGVLYYLGLRDASSADTAVAVVPGSGGMSLLATGRF